METTYHKPVMMNECLDGLNIRPDGVYVDATFGGGGHSRAILSRLGSDGRLVAFDQDGDAVANLPEDERLIFIGENFRYLKNYLRLHGIKKIDGLLADLGISSHQIDVADRGFSTRYDGVLDMRMNRREGVTARDLVATMEEDELAKLLKLYGELPNARQMASAIVKARQNEAIETTQQLCEAVRHHLPRGMENKYLAMLFQALRIEVNGELAALREMLEQAGGLLVDGGRLVVISYHSLEDRLVKNFMRSGNCEGNVEKDFYGNNLSPMKMICKKKASESEVEENPRSRSAQLRVGEKIEVKTRERI